MTVARWKNYVQGVRSHEIVTFWYPGSYGSGDDNKIWYLEDFQNDGIPDKNGNKIDVVDYWPVARQFDVFVNGQLMCPYDSTSGLGDYSVTEHDADNEFSIAFLGDIVIGDSDVVAFKL